VVDFIQRLLGRKPAGSGDVARQRLRMVLMQDRASIAPALWAALKEDLLAVIRRYLEIDEDTMEVDLEREGEAVALVATIPIRRVKRAAGQEGDA
jgi:cell division topological specificity factor